MKTTHSNGPCQGKRKDGTPCMAQATADGFCYWHSPAHRDARRAASSKGGQAKRGRAIRHILENTPAEAVKLRSLADVLAVLESELNVLLALEPGVQRARTVVSLLGVTIAALEKSEFEQRLAALEAAVIRKG